MLCFLTCIFLTSFISAATYIDSCQTLNIPGETYYLTEDLSNSANARCFQIMAKNVVLDCQNHSIINEFERDVIYAKRNVGDYATIRNCKVSASFGFPKPVVRGAGIRISSDYSVVENNEVFDSFYGIYIWGDRNIIRSNVAYGNERGIIANIGDRNIIQENLAKGNTRGFSSWYSEYSKFVNNKAYDNKDGFYIMPLNAAIKCGVSEENSNSDVYVYGTSAARLLNIYGGDYEIIKTEKNAQFTKYPYDCQTTYCTWFGEECLFDRDGDGVPDKDDLCLETSEDEVAIVYGCSCEQILELKPGKDKGELKNGCSKGTIKLFTEQIGWAKNLF